MLIVLLRGGELTVAAENKNIFDLLFKFRFFERRPMPPRNLGRIKRSAVQLIFFIKQLCE